MARSTLREPTVPEAGHTAYRRLREGIASGQFHPNERLVDASIATRLGVGRTAVRAALVRLDQKGLVILEPNRGARVRLISDREALEIEEVRATLEAMLTRRAATRATPADLRELRPGAPGERGAPGPAQSDAAPPRRDAGHSGRPPRAPPGGRRDAPAGRQQGRDGLLGPSCTLPTAVLGRTGPT